MKFKRFATRLLLNLSCSLVLLNPVYAESAGPEKPRYGGTYRAPLDSEPTTLDPALYSDKYAVQVATHLFDGLVRFNQRLTVVSALASHWKISRDRRTYTFLLREGVKFHNGREVTAEDFVYSFTRLLDPQIKSPAASFFLNIEGAKNYHAGKDSKVVGLNAPKPHILKIQLEEPFAPFLSILAMHNAKVIPQEAVNAEFGKHPIGTGPFKFHSWESGNKIALKANDDYFAGRPFLDNLQFRVYSNIEWEQIFTDFQSGQLEHALIPNSQYDDLVAAGDDSESYTIIHRPGLNIVYIGMNMGVTPFDNVKVRRAINYAVDTETIVQEITKRGSTPARGILPPGIAGFDPNFQDYGHNPDKASRLLKEAGFPNGQGFPVIRLWTVSKSASVREQLEAYQADLANVGLKVEIKVAENWKAFITAINNKEADMFYAAWYADYPDPDNFFYPLVHSSSRTNRMRFHNSEIDQLLDTARAEIDYLKRTAHYRAIERQVMENAPIVSLHVNSNNYLFRPWVQGIEMSQLGVMYLPLHKVWFQQHKLSTQSAPQNTVVSHIGAQK